MIALLIRDVKMFSKNNKAQIWVETVIYTLIGLSIIAIILTMALPQIEKSKDKAIIEQTVTALNVLDKKISEVEQAPGNTRVVEFSVSKGKLEISPTDPAGDVDGSIIYTLEDTKLELSEVGQEIKQGNIILKTEKMAARYKITLTMKYPNLNITNKDELGTKTLYAGTTPYKIVIENKETSSALENTHIEFSII
jgi:type II secretory pathway pseudopilin PulG